MVVEELLQLLVAEVDADLLEGVELEDLEAGDVEDADEVDLLHGGVDEGAVAEVHQPGEEPVVHGAGQGRDGVQALVRVLGLEHPLRANLGGVDRKNFIPYVSIVAIFLNTTSAIRGHGGGRVPLPPS